MIYDDFVKKIVEMDDSNCFEKSNRKNNKFNDFYNTYNPKGVEFEFNNGTVFMLPFEKIESITKEYEYVGADYVFALSNGDPFFVKNKKVFTCVHGTKNPDLELVANSFEEFLKMIIKGEN